MSSSDVTNPLGGIEQTHTHAHTQRGEDRILTHTFFYILKDTRHKQVEEQIHTHTCTNTKKPTHVQACGKQKEKQTLTFVLQMQHQRSFSESLHSLYTSLELIFNGVMKS